MMEIRENYYLLHLITIVDSLRYVGIKLPYKKEQIMLNYGKQFNASQNGS
jgi:hypothetical protein